MSTARGWYQAQREVFEMLNTTTRKGGNFSDVLTVYHGLCQRARYNGNYKDGLEIGQCYVSIGELSDWLRVSKWSVKTALTHLRSTYLITTKALPAGTVVTILDKRIFEAPSKEPHPKATQRPPDAHPLTDLDLDPDTRSSGAEAPSAREHTQRAKASSEVSPEDITTVLAEYPRRSGSLNKAEGIKGAVKKIKTREDLEALRRSVANYKKLMEDENQVGTRFVMQLSTFINGRWREFLDVPVPEGEALLQSWYKRINEEVPKPS